MNLWTLSGFHVFQYLDDSWCLFVWNISLSPAKAPIFFRVKVRLITIGVWEDCNSSTDFGDFFLGLWASLISVCKCNRTLLAPPHHPTPRRSYNDQMNDAKTSKNRKAPGARAPRGADTMNNLTMLTAACCLSIDAKYMSQWPNEVKHRFWR
jgi:hypothetical protein